MSLTVNALRKLQETGAFPTPAKGEGNDPSKQTPADAEPQEGKAESQPEAQPGEPPTPTTPKDAQDEIEPSVTPEPELERPAAPVENDVSVPSNELSSTPPAAATPNQPEDRSPKSRTERLEKSASAESDRGRTRSSLEETPAPSQPASTRETPQSPSQPEAISPRSGTERLASRSRSSSRKPTPPTRDVAAADPNMTMPIPPGGFKPETEEVAPEKPADPNMTMPIPPGGFGAEPDPRDAEPERPTVDPNMTMPIPPGGFQDEDAAQEGAQVESTATPVAETNEIESVLEQKSDASNFDPSMTMPIPRNMDSAPEETEEPAVDPSMTMPLPTADPSESEPPAESAAEPTLDPTVTQPFSQRSGTEPIGKKQDVPGPIGSPSSRTPDAPTPQTPRHVEQPAPREDDQVSPALQTDIESLQALVSEAVEVPPKQTDDQSLRPEGSHSRPSSSSTGNTERLEGPGVGEPIPEPITTETYRLFYDPVIPTVDLDATPDPTQTMELKETPEPLYEVRSTPSSTPMEVLRSEPSGTERLERSDTPSEPIEATLVNNPADTTQNSSQQSVVIPTAYERELIEQMSDKETEKHFQNLHNQLGARSNHQMVGSYLFISPIQSPRTADVTAHLALLLEQYDRDVLLIDANLESQTLTRRLEALNQTGLCNILAGTAQPNDSILPTSLKRLRFVPSGDDETGISRVPNRMDMNSIRQLLTALCYDRRTIICDGGSMDSSIAIPMAQAFDGVILVVSMIDLNIDAVHAASRVLKEYQVRNVLGCVVTDS